MNPGVMTPDELLAWVTAGNVDSRCAAGVVHLHGEYVRLKLRCTELLTRWVEYEQLKEDLSIALSHAAAYQKENERLRGLLDAKNPAPWEKS